MSQSLVSTHAITFPFHLSSDLGEGENDLQQILKNATTGFQGDTDLSQLGKWTESDFVPDASPLAYNEHQYFFAYLRSALYGDSVAKAPGTPLNTDSKRNYHYFTFEFSEKRINRRYATRFQGNTYELEVDDMHFSLLRLTGAEENSWYIGTFVLFLSNRLKSQAEPLDILRINSALRQVYPDSFPYDGKLKSGPGLNLEYGGATTREQKFSNRPYSVPDYQTIFGLELQDWLFMKHDVSRFAARSAESVMYPQSIRKGGYPVHATLPKLFYALIYLGYKTAMESLGEKSGISKKGLDFPLVSAIADSRSHVHCWYGNAAFAKTIATRTKLESSYDTSLPGNWWYEFIHGDSGFTTHTHPHQRAEILKRQTDYRWAGLGTLYGFSRYSTVMMSPTYDQLKGAEYTVWVFNNTYFTMVHLVLLQRAGIQLLAREVANYSAEISGQTDASSGKHKRAQQLAMDFSRFRERFYHVMVTPQDQGIDFYEKLRHTFDIDRLMADLEREISFMTAQGELVANQQRAEAANLLNIILAVAVVPTIGTAYYGMNGFRSPLPEVEVASAPAKTWTESNKLTDSTGTQTINVSVTVEQPSVIDEAETFAHGPFIGSQLIGILIVGLGIHFLQRTESNCRKAMILLAILAGLGIGIFGVWIWSLCIIALWYSLGITALFALIIFVFKKICV